MFVEPPGKGTGYPEILTCTTFPKSFQFMLLDKLCCLDLIQLNRYKGLKILIIVIIQSLIILYDRSIQKE